MRVVGGEEREESEKGLCSAMGAFDGGKGSTSNDNPEL